MPTDVVQQLQVSSYILRPSIKKVADSCSIQRGVRSTLLHGQGDREGRPYHTRAQRAKQAGMVRATLAVALAFCRKLMRSTPFRFVILIETAMYDKLVHRDIVNVCKACPSNNSYNRMKKRIH